MSKKTEGQRDMGLVVLVASFVLALLMMIGSQGCNTVKGFARDSGDLFRAIDKSIVQPE